MDYNAAAFAHAVAVAIQQILARAAASATRASPRADLVIDWGEFISDQGSATLLDSAKTLDMLGFAAELLRRLALRERTGLAEQAEVIVKLLVEKNAAYGNSALAPLRVYSKAPAAEQIRVRIDDKLSRLARGARAGEDVEVDLLGYLVLLLIAEGIDPLPR